MSWNSWGECISKHLGCTLVANLWGKNPQLIHPRQNSLNDNLNQLMEIICCFMLWNIQYTCTHASFRGLAWFWFSAGLLPMENSVIFPNNISTWSFWEMRHISIRYICRPIWHLRCRCQAEAGPQPNGASPIWNPIIPSPPHTYPHYSSPSPFWHHVLYHFWTELLCFCSTWEVTMTLSWHIRWRLEIPFASDVDRAITTCKPNLKEWHWIFQMLMQFLAEFPACIPRGGR